MTNTFHVILIKPVRYGEDGYPIQWWKAVYPSLALSVISALSEDCAARKVLGPDIEILTDAYDDQCGLPPVRKMIRQIKTGGAGGMVGMVAVHTAQFPRCAALARVFRAAGISVVIGGSHVSGVMATSPSPPPELAEMLDLGVSLFLGEAEDRLEILIKDARAGKMKPVYNFAGKPVDLSRAILPSRLPEKVDKRIAWSLNPITPIEAGRGCPRKCSFCTVVNVHGREARSRLPETVAGYIRSSAKKGRTRFLFTDDNFARNRHWKEILEAMIRLREEEGHDFSFALQADTRSHLIPGFIDLSVRAGCDQIFVGMESINPDALASVHKNHNAVDSYLEFCLAWKKKGVIILAGYILGFPGDTSESIRKDLETIKDKLPVDLLYPFILTPLPGSEDHAAMKRSGVPMDPDLSRYTTFHATTVHPRMRGEELEALYHEVFQIFYTDSHSLRIMRRHLALGGDLELLLPFMAVARSAFSIEGVNPAEIGIFRMKSRKDRRHDLPLEKPLPFYLRRIRDAVRSQISWYRQLKRTYRMAEYAKAHPISSDDPALGMRSEIFKPGHPMGARP